jgi:hypothetical protein
MTVMAMPLTIVDLTTELGHYCPEELFGSKKHMFIIFFMALVGKPAPIWLEK